jgi:hypothetical protein
VAVHAAPSSPRRRLALTVAISLTAEGGVCRKPAARPAAGEGIG